MRRVGKGMIVITVPLPSEEVHICCWWCFAFRYSGIK